MFTFASERIENEWDNLHPELQAVLDDFGHWSNSQRFPIPVVTCIARTKEENAAIYNGKDKFSWHVPLNGVNHAIDLRTRHYNTEQLSKVFAWFHENCPDIKKWELIVKPHGTGPHIHLARRDHNK